MHFCRSMITIWGNELVRVCMMCSCCNQIVITCAW